MRVALACFLLLLGSALAQDARVTQRYRTFINQHINPQMSSNACDAVIDRRGINQTDSNLCKQTNTFILATAGLVTPICNQAGQPDGDMTRSLQPFAVVVCTLKNQGARRPHCQYSGRALTRRIKVRCEQGFPVHYERGVVVLDN